MRNTELSIIIVSYNTKNLLEECLNSIYRSLQDSPSRFEVIVVDNGSTDGSRIMVEKNYKKTLLITNKNNVGFGKANNQGVIKAQGDTILLLNSDVQVQDQAINKLYNFHKTLPTNTITGGKLYNPDGTAQPSCGPAYSLLNIFLALFLKGDYLNLTRYSPNVSKRVDWIMGACMMMMRSAFSLVGGFDEGIFMYMEEIDWEYRAQKRGYQIYFYPEAAFTHVGAGSSHGRATPILNVYRGLIYYYKKHHNHVENTILRVILILKAVFAIGLFSILYKKDDHKLYKEALKLAISI